MSDTAMDRHYVFSSATGRCKLFDGTGTLLIEFPMGDAAVAGPGFGRWGRCPRGTYRLGEPVPVDEPAMGRWFTPVLGVPNRDGIGIHGGGTGLAHPFEPQQPLLPTHGCLRVHNLDNEVQVGRRRPGDRAFLTVEGP